MSLRTGGRDLGVRRIGARVVEDAEAAAGGSAAVNDSPWLKRTVAAELDVELRPEPFVAAEELEARQRDHRPVDQRIVVAPPDVAAAQRRDARPPSRRVSQLCAPASAGRPAASYSLRLMTTVVVGTPVLDRGDAEGLDRGRHADRSTRAARPIAFGGWLNRRLVIAPRLTCRSSFDPLERDALVVERLGERRRQLVARRGLFTQAVPSRASAGRGLTGSGPEPRSCGTSGFCGLPLITTLKPTDAPYM